MSARTCPDGVSRRGPSRAGRRHELRADRVGGVLEDDVKAILSDICRAINQRIRSSRGLVAEVKKLEKLGYELSLYLEATLLLTRIGETAKPKGRSRKRRPTRVRSGSLKLSDRDIKYLRSLKISLDDKDA